MLLMRPTKAIGFSMAQSATNANGEAVEFGSAVTFMMNGKVRTLTTVGARRS